jgi:phosphoribosylformylglycinamidine synthase subunit PurL
VISTQNPDAVIRIAKRHAVPARRVGKVTPAASGAAFRISDTAFSAPIQWLSRAFHDAIPAAMDGASPAEHAVSASHAPLTD